MPNDPLPQSIADLPAQRAAAPRSKAEARARYFNTGNAFNLQLPPVPDESFTAEPARALDPAAPTGLVACDRSRELGCAFPATTPLVLARYARVRAGESFETNFAASGVIAYVIAGSGSTTSGGESIEWRAGDTFVLPGGSAHVHRAGATDAVLWVVTNEPQLAFENLLPPAPGTAPTDLVHFPADEIDRQIELLYRVGRSEEIAGSALIFSSERQEAIRNVLPTLTVAMNSLPAGKAQRPHRHNSVAVSLVIRGEGCYSIVDGRRKDWSQWATTVTPATSVHSHHNGGSGTALFLIVQDGGIYYHTRALGFEFVDA
jgi:gentisate 1,2-dioxygenase